MVLQPITLKSLNVTLNSKDTTVKIHVKPHKNKFPKTESQLTISCGIGWHFIPT